MEPRVRKPVSSSLAFAGSDYLSDGEKRIHNETSLAETGAIAQGNRCGHDKLNPDSFKIPAHHKNRFPVIEKAKANLTACYYNPLSQFVGKLFYHEKKFTKRGNRKVRSEQRAVITHKVGQVILHYTNIEMMTLGMMIKDKMITWGIEFIAKQAQISAHQCREALKAFEACGYISIQERREKQLDGTWKSEPSIITVNPQLYLDLGVDEEDLNKHRISLAEKAKAREREQKAKEFFKSQRLLKKQAKKEIKAMKQILREVNELPGSERKREEAPLYRDYTGCSRENIIADGQRREAPQALKDILRRLSVIPKPPS